MQRFFVRNLAVRQGYRLTCLMSNLTEQAFYAGVGTTSPYLYRSNEVVAGIVAEAFGWHILKIAVLWVDERYRHKGYASSLMKEVEKKALELGCKVSQLSTF